DITRRQVIGHNSIRHEPEEVDVFNSQLRFFLPPPDDVFFVSANDYKLGLRQKSSEVQQQFNSEALIKLTGVPEGNLLRGQRQFGPGRRRIEHFIKPLQVDGIWAYHDIVIFQLSAQLFQNQPFQDSGN